MPVPTPGRASTGSGSPLSCWRSPPPSSSHLAPRLPFGIPFDEPLKVKFVHPILAPSRSFAASALRRRHNGARNRASDQTQQGERVSCPHGATSTAATMTDECRDARCHECKRPLMAIDCYGHRVERQGLDAGEDRCRAKQAEGVNAAWWPVGSLVGGAMRKSPGRGATPPRLAIARR